MAISCQLNGSSPLPSDSAFDDSQGARPIAEKNLVVRRVGSGTFVSYAGPIHQGMEDIADLVSPLQLIETRFAIEPYMTRLAGIHATGSDLDTFEDVLRRIEAAEDDPTLFTQLDSEFHLDLARCSRNPLIVRMYQQVNMVACMRSGTA